MSSYEGHTPGKWEVIGYDKQVDPCIAIGIRLPSGRINWICEVANGDEIITDTVEADANLIASAPELLAERNRMQNALWMLANCKFGGIRAKQRMQQIAAKALQESDNDTH